MTLPLWNIPLEVIDQTGNAVTGAQVNITLRVGSSVATVYTSESGSATLTQPLLTDSNGRVNGWLLPGKYIAAITFEGSSFSQAFDALPYDYELPRLIPGSIITAAETLPVNALTPVNATSGALTETLPTGQTAGIWIAVQKTDSSTNVVTISGSIRGSAGTINLQLLNETVILIADSAGSWWPSASHKTLSSLDARYTLLADSGWVTMTGLGSGWTAGSPAPAYRKIGNIVYLRGSFSASSSSTTGFTFPSGFMPAQNWIASSNLFFISSGGAFTASSSGAHYIDGEIFLIN